jgi:hypothetical protein
MVIFDQLDHKPERFPLLLDCSGNKNLSGLAAGFPLAHAKVGEIKMD